MKRRILSLVITMAMLVTLLGISPLSVAAGTNGIYTYATKTDGTIGITGCDQTATGSITIPTTLDGYQVTSINNWAFKDCTGITEIIIPEGITSIGYGAFYNCTGIKTISIAESVDSIGYKAFWTCSGLEKIDLPEEMTTIDYAAFQYCSSLKEVVIPRGVSALGGSMFNYCSALKTITIPDTVKTVGAAAFKGCDVFETVYFTGTKEEWNSISVGTENETLTGASIYYEPYFTYEARATAADEAVITGTFEEVGESVAILSAIRGFKVTEIGAMAFADKDITSVTIPKSVTTIGASAFSGCGNLTDVYYTGSEDDWNDLTIGADNECLTSATVHFASIDPSLYTYTVSDEGEATITACDSAISGDVVIPDTLDGYPVTAIASKVFYGCENITSIVVPNSVKTISFGAFMYCSNLESIVLSNKMTAIGNSLFSYCVNLREITIPSSITTVGVSTFSNCDVLNDVYYGGTEEEWTAITVNTGNDCLTNVTIHYTEKEIPATGLTIDKDSADLYVGDFVALTATVEPEDATNKNIIWSSSDETVAMVEDGMVTALLAGETVITATTEDGGYTVSCSITVKEPEPNSYTVEFYDFEGNLISTQTIIEGNAAEAPALENTDKYEFISWDQDFSSVTENMVIKPVYNEFVKVIGIGMLDGIVVDLGDAVTEEKLPADVTVYLADETEAVITVIWDLADIDFSEVGTYTVKGELELTEFYKNPDGLMAEIEVEIVAPEPEPVYYTVTFMADGVEIGSQTVVEGSAVEAPEAPEKEGYSFIGWDTEEYSCVMSDLTVNAVYEEIVVPTPIYISSITPPGSVIAVNPDSIAEIVALFPTTVSATLSDGTEMEYSVEWNVPEEIDLTVAGPYTVAGRIVLPDDANLGAESVLDTQIVVIIELHEETDKYINVPNVIAQSGDEVTVTITIDEDPGMAIGSFMIDYDRDKLALVDYSFGAIIENVNPIINTDYDDNGITKIFVSFMGVNDIMTGGELITLTFKVNETVSNETIIPVTVDGIQFYNANENTVNIMASNGYINVLNYTLADVNNDGIINLIDAFRILQYDVGLRTFSASEMLAADVNCDGVINVLDALRIQKYNAGLIESL